MTDLSGRRAVPLLVAAGAVVAVALGGCAQTVAGTPSADAAAASEVKADQEHRSDCDAARSGLTDMITQALKRGETDPQGAASTISRLGSSDAPRDFGRRCGPELIGPAYSQLLLDVRDFPLSTSAANQLRSYMLIGLCQTQGKITLSPEAKTVCDST